MTAPATAWLIVAHAGNWVTSTLPWGIPSVDSGVCPQKKEKKNPLMDRWKNTALQMAYFIKDMAKCLSNPITPPARSHTGLFRLVTDAITIHTCSSHLRLHLAGETPALFPSFSAGHARTKQDVWLWNSWRPPSKTKIKEQNLTEKKCHDLLRSYINTAGSWRAVFELRCLVFHFLVILKKLRQSSGYFFCHNPSLDVISFF